MVLRSNLPIYNFRSIKILMNFARVLKISRPRFWLYLFATYFAIGGIAAVWQTGNFNNLLNPTFLLFALYFTLPANLLLYGINDIYDYETDKHNPKKIEYEALVRPEEWRPLFGWIILLNIPFLIYTTFLDIKFFYAFCVFLISSLFYSMPPVRAKARPILDMMMSATNYVSAGILGFLIAGGGQIKWEFVLAGFLWCMAMHAFSAVPDIQADKEAKVYTVATLLGRQTTLILCFLLYAFSAVLVFKTLPFVSIFGGVIYSFLMLYSVTKNDKQLFKIYKIFPLLNALAGAAIFFEIIFNIL